MTPPRVPSESVFEQRWLIAQQQFDGLQAAVLTGRELWLFGCRARLRIEWVDRQPFPDAWLRKWGEAMTAKAQAQASDAVELVGLWSGVEAGGSPDAHV